MSVNIIIGHSNMDIDCFGSMAMARYLYPEHILVRSGRIHPVAKNLYTIYRDHLNMIPAKDLKGLDVDQAVVVDTRQASRVSEYFRFLPDFQGDIVAYDHHGDSECDLPGAQLISGDYGANTSMMTKLLAQNGIVPDELDATIALAGIYADTGNFTHGSVRTEDFEAAAYLLAAGASIDAVRRLMSKLREEHQVSLFHRLLNEISFHTIHGFSVITSFMKLEGQMAGLAAVIEQIFEVEDADAYIAVFQLEKEDSQLIIGRAGNPRIDLNLFMNIFGGAGHPQAASALVKHSCDIPIYKHVLQMLEQRLNQHALTGLELMRPAITVNGQWTMMETSLYLEQTNNSGAPVVDEQGHLNGMITLKDIQKARKVQQMQAPVRAYMSKNVISAGPDSSIREIEKLFYQHDIGHIPIVEDETVVGMVTRSDYLRFIHTNLQLPSLVLEPKA